MLNAFTFDDINKLEGVRCAGSEEEKDPLHDSNLTLFLENGYRLISTMTALGQTLELEPFDDGISSSPSFKAQIYHNAFALMPKPQDKAIQIRNGIQSDIHLETFIDEMAAILSQEVIGFLKERHAMLPFRSIKNRP